MLTHTFCHIPHVGPKLELQLWLNGIRSWEDALAPSHSILSPKRADHISRHIRESQSHLLADNPYYFAAGLPSNQYWRLFPAFRAKTAYIDIETTGMNGYDDHITSIALYDGSTVRCYVYDQNLYEFKDDIKQFDVIVSYNGSCFDIPFIESFFMIKLPQVHIDLRFLLRSLGYSGGLKTVEKQIGISRGELDGIDGFFAVLLWYEYVRNNNLDALHTMLAYNIADTVNLERLMVFAYNRKIELTPFYADHVLPAPSEPASPYQPHPGVVCSLTRKYYSR